MRINLNKPFTVLRIGKGAPLNDWNQSKVNVETYLLLYLEEGSLNITIGEKDVKVVAGDIVIVPKNTSYAVNSAQGAFWYFVNFEASHEEPSDISDKTVGGIFNKGRFWPKTYVYVMNHNAKIVHVDLLTHCQRNAHVENIFRRMETLDLKNYDVDILLLNILLQELLIMISGEMKRHNALSHHLTKMIKYIEEHYKDDIGLASLAAQFELSQVHVARLFQRELNTSTSEYVNRVRISAACSMLLNTDMSIGSIAEEVGYQNQYYFNRVFKRYNSMTPGEYRRQKMFP